VVLKPAAKTYVHGHSCTVWNLPSTCLASLTSSASYNAATHTWCLQEQRFQANAQQQDPQGSLEIHCRFTRLHFAYILNNEIAAKWDTSW
jgi:hypothetical protein